MSWLLVFELGKNRSSPEFKPKKLRLDMSRVIAMRAEAAPIADGEYR
jgi:hypothetical protein